ncbi:hypothetical protein LSH36_37g02000 [Paralvinella palmiformis]|uniref:BTB domain-containing protein n=1 Tax=Paralvinella palmiformis TaxID=53620 RepID=A0AAD9NDU1_9ANNE|nr:hypothetical protein LSH36_37g02000 [Paralvinella palmiformis]
MWRVLSYNVTVCDVLQLDIYQIFAMQCSEQRTLSGSWPCTVTSSENTCDVGCAVYMNEAEERSLRATVDRKSSPPFTLRHLVAESTGACCNRKSLYDGNNKRRLRIHMSMLERAYMSRDSSSPQSAMSSPVSANAAVNSAVNSHFGKISGVPCPATPTRYTAPVHIDVGGSIYTSSLETLTKFPESKLARLFNGSIPIILDSLKQHYFIDRDGKMFRHVLNFLRTSRLVLPQGFNEFDLLYDEARYYDIPQMVKAVEQSRTVKYIKSEVSNSDVGVVAGSSTTTTTTSTSQDEEQIVDCVVMNISPDLGERISLSADRILLEEMFPELNSALMDTRNSGWNMDNRFVLRFPLNGYCKLNSLQVMQRLLGHGFKIVASTGGGVEGQQFSEYVFSRRRGATN